jgi:hypothetical protein
MTEPWPQEEPEDEDAQPPTDEPERPSDTVVAELDHDWED